MTLRECDESYLFNFVTMTYTCQFCGIQFLLKGKLHKHLKRKHIAKPFRCGYCDKSFTEAYYRKLHMVSVCKNRWNGKY